MSVAIVTDSTCDLSLPFLQTLGIYMVPLMVTVEGATYRDRIDMPPERYLTLGKRAVRAGRSTPPIRPK